MLHPLEREHLRTTVIVNGVARTVMAGSFARDQFMSQLLKNIRKVSSVDGAVVLDLGRGTMFRINQVGARILDLLEQDTPFAEIAERLSADFGVGLEIVEADLRDFMECLRLHGVAGEHPAGPCELEKEAGSATSPAA